MTEQFPTTSSSDEPVTQEPPSQAELDRRVREAKAAARANKKWFARHKVLTGTGAAAVIAAAGVGLANSSDAASTGEGGAGLGAAAAVAEPADLKPEDFQEVSSEEWEDIAKAPGTSEGDAVIVYAEVTQFDSATGSDLFLANVGAEQPAGESQLETNTVFTGSDGVLEGISSGDVLKVRATVVGSRDYETQIGGNTTAPELAVDAVEDVGFMDLTSDARIGGATYDEYGMVGVPVTVVNSGEEMLNYEVSVVAESRDGSTNYGTASAYASNLSSGQSAEVSADFYDIPEDAVFRVASVERYEY